MKKNLNGVLFLSELIALIIFFTAVGTAESFYEGERILFEESFMGVLNQVPIFKMIFLGVWAVNVFLCIISMLSRKKVKDNILHCIMPIICLLVSDYMYLSMFVNKTMAFLVANIAMIIMIVVSFLKRSKSIVSKTQKEVDEIKKEEEEKRKEVNDRVEKLTQKRKNMEQFITSSETIPGKEIVKVLGIVSGSSTDNPAGLIGEGYLHANKKMQLTVDRAKWNMMEEAEKLNADAIISFKMTTTKNAFDQTIVSVTGTAVKIKDAESKEPKNSSLSNADEIIKYKQLLDNGIITQEEFDAKKKQLLGL